jgi:hypothetical protein
VLVVLVVEEEEAVVDKDDDEAWVTGRRKPEVVDDEEDDEDEEEEDEAVLVVVVVEADEVPSEGKGERNRKSLFLEKFTQKNNETFGRWLPGRRWRNNFSYAHQIAFAYSIREEIKKKPEHMLSKKHDQFRKNKRQRI